MTLRIAVLGAAGAMAQVVLRDLLEHGGDLEITAADLRLPAGAGAAVRPAAVDVRDEAATARLLAGHDAVLNCVTYYLNVPIMRAALAARVPYTDLGGLYHGTMKQLALDDDFARAGVPALLGMGSTPGITNVMAGELAADLDTVEEIHVRVGCIDRGTAAMPLPIPYALDTVLDELTLEPMVLREGEAVAVPPLTGAEEIEFPAPVGSATAFYTLHSEVAMFPRSFPGLREASFKVAFEPELVRKLRFLIELGFAGREPVVGEVSARRMLLALAARQPAPAGDPQDCDALRVEVKGRRGGAAAARRAEAVVLPHPEWKVAAGALDTGVPLSIAGLMLARREITTPGVLYPEVAVPRTEFFAELAKRGIEVRWS